MDEMACMAFGTQFTIIHSNCYLQINTNPSRSCWEFVSANCVGAEYIGRFMRSIFSFEFSLGITYCNGKDK